MAHGPVPVAAERQRIATLRERGLRAVIGGLLEQDWSPEQIAAHLRRAHPDRTGWHVCHETIYQALYHGGKGGLSRTLTRRLRTGRPLSAFQPGDVEVDGEYGVLSLK